jgi:cholesterol oxidase
MQRLSSLVETMKSHYTVVVVGSGYGGAITASRLARAGQQVCLLERGKERQPGEYPKTLASATAEVQLDTPAGHLGAATGMFDVKVNAEMNAVVGCGLGGTSLINANVSLRPEPRIFSDPRWPTEIQRAGLEEWFLRAEEILRPVPYPEDSPPLPKMQALERSAGLMGERFYRPPLNVTFADGVNPVGVEQHACTLCGDCVSGCNEGAKSTVLMNYLPDAVNHGAEIFTEVPVRWLERRDGRWLVHYQPLAGDRGVFDARDLVVSANVVVLSAGTFGSTEILLRSKASGLPLSDRLGHHFSANGDVLGFGYNGDHAINGIGFGHLRAGEAEPVGPCISGIIDIREQPKLERGLVIEEGSIPGALAEIMPTFLAVSGDLVGEDMKHGVVDFAKREARKVESRLRGPRTGAVHNTQTYLVMSNDDGEGRMVLEDDRVRVQWPGIGDRPVFHRDNRALEAATRALGGQWVENPIWSKALHHRLITVHPLGGCVMADRAQDGVVDHQGQVYAGAEGTSVHDGLYVADGAIVPRALGVNPLFTISALAERNAALLARARNWTIDYALPTSLRLQATPRTLGVQFTERMQGFFVPDAGTDYETGARRGEAEGSSFAFTLTIVSDDLESLVAGSAHDAGMYGTVTAPRLSPTPLTVTNGIFNLFTVDPGAAEARRMRYRMVLVADDGRRFFVDGFKLAAPAAATDIWSATSTLYITVYDGANAEGPVLGKGILRIEKADFALQLTTMRALNASSETQRLETLTRFGRYFAGQLWEVYGRAVLEGLARKLRA